MKTRISPFLAALAGAALLTAGCSGRDDAGKAFSDEDSLLRYVPADTPYLIYTGEPLPDDLVDALSPSMDRVLAAYRQMLRETYRSGLAESGAPVTPSERARMDAVFDALVSMLSPDGLAKAGFDRDSRMVVFGNGLLPVLHVEINDEAAFDAAISELEAAAGQELETMALGESAYRYFGSDEGKLVIGIANGNAVVAFVPANFSEEETGRVLGLELPGKNIAEAAILAEMASKYDFSSHYVGFVDMRRLAAVFTEEPAGLDAALLGNSGLDASSVPAVCREEIMGVVDIVPRMVFGYDEVNLERISGSMIVEMRPDIAAQLAGVAALVPGLGLDHGGLLSFGVSMDLMAWRAFLEARLDALEADPFECEYFADLQAGVAQGRQLLATPIPPVAYGIRGFNAVVDSLEGFDVATKRPPSSVDASIVLAMDDPAQLLALGSMFSPELANLQLQPDGKPQALDLPQLRSVGEEAYAAMLSDALAISVGKSASSRVGEALNAASAEPPVVFGMTMDAGRYYEMVGAGVAVQPQDGDGSQASPETQQAVAEIMTVMGEIYDRMATSLRFTGNGAELRTEVTLEDL